ncbi:MAG TPA: HEAT repeat domain-containing protein, partial [Haliangiales bacterium]|nr:HEAT repeat domain-containing protein [Haliangiales bacterium]
RPEAVRPHLFPLDARRCRILYRAAVEADRPALLLALREGDTALRAAAAGVLGLLDAEAETRGALVLALTDEDARVRAVAAGALGASRDRAAAAALESATADTESEVRAAAARALGRLGVGAAALRGLVAGGGRPAVEALEALAGFRDPADAPRFRAALAGDDAEIVKIAIRLGNLPWADIVPLLAHARWDVRAAAVEVLREVPEAAGALAAHRRRETDPLVLRLLES